MTNANPPAGLGHNKPPEATDTDPFLEKLEEDNHELLDRQMRLDLQLAKLPTEVKSDEDVAACTKWVTEARKLARDTENYRTTANKPLLEMKRKLDGWFNGIRDGMKNTADKVEQRSAPYLSAKRAREEAERQRQAEERRKEQLRLEEEAAAAKRAAEEAAEAARKEQERLANIAAEAEANRLAAEQQAAEDEAPDVSEEFVSSIDADAAEEATRQAELTSQQAAQTAAAAEEAANKASALAEKADRNLNRTHTLGRASGGGGNARVNVEWEARIDDIEALRKSLGPIGEARLLSQQTVLDAVARAARMDPRPEIPGVSYHSREVVKTSATRS